MYLIMNKLQVYVPAKHIERTNIREGLSLYIRREREGKTEELSTLTERKMVWQNIWAPLFRHLWRDSLEHSHWKGKKHFSMSAISSKLFSSSESLSLSRAAECFILWKRLNKIPCRARPYTRVLRVLCRYAFRLADWSHTTHLSQSNTLILTCT